MRRKSKVIRYETDIQRSLSEVDCFTIESKSSCGECLPGCEAPNLYIVYRGEEGKNKEEVCRMVELFEDPCDMKCYCCLRGFHVQLRDEKSDRLAAATSKCRPPCYMCCPLLSVMDLFRPRIDVRGLTKEAKLGEVTYPLWCCWLPSPGCRGCCSALELDLLDDNQQLRFTVSAPLLNPGFLCGCMGGVLQMCERRVYYIYDRDGNLCGEIVNLYRGWYDECCSRGDRFTISMPPQAMYEDRQRLLLVVAFIDFLQYGS